jgi:hypothetical protein
MSISIQRDLRDAFECAMRKYPPPHNFELDNGVYVDKEMEKCWQDFLFLGVEALASQGRA